VCGVVLATPALRVLARDKRVRVTHGLEHATIRILEAKQVSVNGGVTLGNHFAIQLDHDGRNWNRDDDVRDAVEAAIRRVAGGEHALAYSPRCGTSLAVAYLILAVAVLAAGLTAAALGVPTGITFAASVGAALVARLAARRLGLLAQRLFTVSTDLVSAKVVEVDKHLIAGGTKLVFTVKLDVVVRDPHAEPVTIV